VRERLRSVIPRLPRRRRPLAEPPQAGLAALLERLNPASLARATGHRVILNRHLTALGMPVPSLHGVIGRDGGWSAEGGRPVTGAEEAGRFLAGLPGDLALRPYAWSLGSETRLLRREGDGLVDGDGRTRSPAEVAAQALADPACALFVVQERVAVDALLRLTTFLGAEGAAQVVHACRVGPKGDLVEIAVDAADAGARATACRAAALLAPQRSIAWEVATTAGGARILDADSRYAPVAGPLFAAAVRAMGAAA
jgi:hypothetical protein